MTPINPVLSARDFERIANRNHPYIENLINNPYYCEGNSGNLYNAVMTAIDIFKDTNGIESSPIDSETDDFFENGQMKFTFSFPHKEITEKGDKIKIIDAIFLKLALQNGLDYMRDLEVADKKYNKDLLRIIFRNKNKL